MTALAELQGRLAAALLHPDASPTEGLVGLVRVQGLSAERRIAIYQANVLGGRIRVLEKLFPVCRRVLGEVCFAALSRGYAVLEREPRRDPDAVGEGFPDRLQREVAGTRSLSGLEYLPDLARLELARHRAWYAPDSNPFDFAAFQGSLQRHAGDAHRFQLNSTLTLLTSEWPVDRIWQVNQSDDPAEVAGEGTPIHLAVWRVAGEVGQVRVSTPVYRLLEALGQGISLGALDAVDPGANVGPLLPQMIQRGFLTGFEV